MQETKESEIKNQEIRKYALKWFPLFKKLILK